MATKTKIKKGFTLSGDEVNSMLEAVKECIPARSVKITQPQISKY